MRSLWYSAALLLGLAVNSCTEAYADPSCPTPEQVGLEAAGDGLQWIHLSVEQVKNMQANYDVTHHEEHYVFEDVYATRRKSDHVVVIVDFHKGCVFAISRSALTAEEFAKKIAPPGAPL